jgi:septum formation protein
MVVLASSSPRRRELLANAGIEFRADSADIDESRRDGESPVEYASRLAREKANAVSARSPNSTVIGADTIVIVDNEVLGKPQNAADARRMLRLLRGRTHQVTTAIAVISPRKMLEHQETTDVHFGPVTDDEIDAYVRSGEPMDKAGAYAIQGWASKWIDRIDGDYFNVVGLPVAAVWKMLKEVARET